MTGSSVRFFSLYQQCSRAVFVAMLIMVMPALLFATPANALHDTCASTGSTQYFAEMKVCVSSVLSAQGRFQYGPDQLLRGQGAWCEGEHGHGVGEIIRFEFVEAGPPVRFQIRNGYVKSDKAFRNNGRVAVFRMSDDAGNSTTINLGDTGRTQSIRVPWNRERVHWYQFVILEVYAGRRYDDTCISSFRPDFEGF